MRNSQYWTNRANKRMAKYQRNSDKTISIINAAYDKAIKDINEDISNIFLNYLINYDLTGTEATKLLNSHIPNPLIKSIKKALPYVKNEEIKRWMQAQVNSPAYKARITRLEALKQSIEINCKLIADTELKESKQLYVNNIKAAYYSSAYDIQKGVGIGYTLAEMPTELIEEILKNNWSGKLYSERIWNNSETLNKRIQEVITSGLMSGKSSRRMATELEELTQYGKFAAERLIRTETTYVTNMAELEGYKANGVKEYMFVATLDLRTSKQCREMDGKIIKVVDAVSGENLPPLHPYCRSITRAFISKEDLANRRRRARGEDGKTYIIDGNITYNEWYKNYVKKS